MQNLEGVSIFQDVIRVNIASRSAEEKTVDPIKSIVVFQASAVVQVGESEFLLEMGCVCGLDYHDATQEYPGSDQAHLLKEQLTTYAHAHGWRILPGVIGF